MSEVADVFIAGGGPAGLAAAIAASTRGLRVIVADANEPPIDKACGEGLLPDTVSALARLGVTFSGSDGYELRGIRFFDEGAAPGARFSAGSGRGLRRKILHEKLVHRAMDSGVSLLWRTRVTGLCRDGALLDGTRLRARWIIGADGVNSLVRRWSGLDLVLRGPERYAYRRHFRVHPWTDCVEVYWGSGVQIYVTPVGPEEVCAAVISRNPRLRLGSALKEFPRLASRLEERKASTSERGGISATLKLPCVFRGRVVLVGDASGCVDAITGEGLGLAFKQAEALADALAADDLRRYVVAHRQTVRRVATMAELLLALAGRPAWRRQVMRTVERQPQVFAAFLAAHLQTTTDAALFAAEARLGWHLLMPQGALSHPKRSSPNDPPVRLGAPEV